MELKLFRCRICGDLYLTETAMQSPTPINAEPPSFSEPR